VSSLGLKKCLDAVFFVQGLEVVITYQCHSSQQAVAKQTNVSLTSDMFLVYGIRHRRQTDVNVAEGGTAAYL